MSFPRYPAYKPSGVEWLGEVPQHWQTGQSRRKKRTCLEKNKKKTSQLQLSRAKKKQGNGNDDSRFTPASDYYIFSIFSSKKR
jgi:hypothetical protein